MNHYQNKTKNFPKVSIITPSFNQGAFIEETIDSVLSQDYPNLEHIIIDGGSTDKTVEIIKKYEKHLAYWASEKDSGQSEAINKGFRYSTGDILTWICSDDLLIDNALKKVVHYFNENQNTILVHGKTKTFGEGYEDKITAGFHSDLKIDYFTHMAFPQPSSFFRRNLFEKQSYGTEQKRLVDESLHYCMDYDLALRGILNYDFLKVEEVFSAYRLHPESKTISLWHKFETEKDKVFLRLLKTLEAKEELFFLKDIGIQSDEEVIYNYNQKKVESLDIEKIALMFLYRKIPVLFDTQQFEQVVLYCEAIKERNKMFYQEMKLESFHKTSQYNTLSAVGKLKWKVDKIL